MTLLRTTHPAPHTTQRATLTVVIIAKNEEQRIRRCLASIRWADEIVVVDGCSTDRTVEICRSFGARIVSHTFEGDFSIERNLGIEAATCEWVLQLDADDVVTDGFRQAVMTLLAHDDPAFDAYKFRRKSVLLSQPMRYGGWLYYIPNLVRRRTVRFTGKVHERPVVPGKIGVIEADIEHHPFQTIDEFRARQDRYTTLQAQEIFERDGRLPLYVIRWRMMRRPFKTFWKRYVKKQGFREGRNGLRFALLYAWVERLKWQKYRELIQTQGAWHMAHGTTNSHHKG